jgi:lipoprotein-anchoring transpeptidase ErfK/SrfK
MRLRPLRVLLLSASLLGAGSPLLAQPLDQWADPAVTGSLGRQISNRDMMQAANGLGGGFIENLFAEGQPRGPSLAGTPLPPLPDQPTIYAPAEPVRPLPDQRRRASLTHAPIDYGVVAPEFMRQEVSYQGPHKAGTIVIDTPNRHLYLVQPGGTALRYGIGVGRPGFEWAGVKSVTRKAEWPDWRPPAEMLKRRPDLPRYMAGGPENPLGARAMYLGSSLYRIHGTNEPSTIGHAVSSGCIRMTNDDVVDLYNRVRVGARVIVR